MKNKFALALFSMVSMALYAPIEKKDITSLIGNKQNLIHTAIIGSGPAGLSAAIPPRRAGFHTVVFLGPKPFGELMDASIIENWPAMEKRSGADSMKVLEKQVSGFGAALVPLSVTEVDFSMWPYRLHLSDESIVYALTVICATGASQQKVGIEGEDIYWGKGLFSCGLCDGSFVRNKHAVIIGGGDIAIQRALQLLPEAESITMIIPTEKMTAHLTMQKKIEGIDRIKKIFNKQVTKIGGQDGFVSYVELVDTKSQKKSKLPTSGIFLSTGLTPNSELYKNKLTLESNGCIKLISNGTQETSLEGVFAAGTVADNMYRQVGAIVGDGTKAGLDSLKLLSKWGFDGQIAISPDDLYKPAQIPHPNIKQIQTVQEFNRAIRTTKDVLVEIYSPTCSTCRKMEGPVSAVTEHFKNILNVFQIDKDKLLKLVKKQKISLIPAFIFYKNGKEIDRMEGEASFNNLKQFIERGVNFSKKKKSQP